MVDVITTDHAETCGLLPLKSSLVLAKRSVSRKNLVDVDVSLQPTGADPREGLVDYSTRDRVGAPFLPLRHGAAK